MKKKKIIINQCISILVLFVYLFGSSSILSFHSHSEVHGHDHHHHQDVFLCEYLHQSSFIDSNCSHESHIISSEESCPLCDHFSNCKPAILDLILSSNINGLQLEK